MNAYSRDPNLWMVKCRIGEEKATVMHMMRKFIAYQFSNEPLQIKSVIAPEGVKGYVYIEAYKQPHVKQAILNVSNLRMGQWTQQVWWYIIGVERNVCLRVILFYRDPHKIKLYVSQSSELWCYLLCDAEVFL